MTRLTYSGYVIRFDPPPIPDREHDYQFEADDYDGAPDAFDDRKGTAPTLNDAYDAIDRLILDLAAEEFDRLHEAERRAG